MLKYSLNTNLQFTNNNYLAIKVVTSNVKNICSVTGYVFRYVLILNFHKMSL